MANKTLNLFYDLDLRIWTTTLGGTTEQGPIANLIQGDIVTLNVKFVQSGVAVTLTAPVFTASSIKAENDFTGSYLIQLAAPTGSPPLYTFTVSPLNSAQLNTFLQTYRNTWCALELYDSANGILTTPLTLEITPGYSLSGTPTDNVDGVIVVAAGKTVTFPNTLTFPSAAGTNGQQLTLSNSTTGLLEWAASGISGLTVGTTTITSGTTTRVLYDNAGVVGEYAISGTGSVAMTDSPQFTTPSLGAATATSINGITITAGAGTLTLGNGSITTSTNGYINTSGGTGYINTSADLGGFTGGHINTQGGTSAIGGYIRTHAGVLGTGIGAAGGYINTSNGGGNIDTTAGGSITTGAGALIGPAGGGTIATNETISGGTLAGSFTTLAASGTATLAAVNATGNITAIAAATQDAIRLAGRAGGTSSYILTLSPTTLTASRTATFPDASITVARTDAAQTFTGVQTFSSAPVIPAGSNTVPSIMFASDTSSTASGLWDGGASGRIGFITGGINRMSLAATAYNLASNITINFNSATNISGYNDTTLRRGGIGLLNICAGTASSDSTTTANAKVGMGCAVLTPTTVANLPASPAAGWVAAVNNADTPVVGSTVVGGASAFALVCYNGSAWKVVAI
jgi:hypothetical protein